MKLRPEIGATVWTMWLGTKYQDRVDAAAAGEGPEEPAGGDLRLAEANINPLTGLATDYLNTFNEAIMLLEMLSSAPEFRDDFMRWQPVSYREHFAGSHFKARNVAIAAYERTAPQLRTCLDALTGTMTAMLEATRAALRDGLPPAAAAALADEAAAALKPLVARAGALINGDARHPQAPAPQAAVDALMRT